MVQRESVPSNPPTWVEGQKVTVSVELGNFEAEGKPTISGTAQVGQTLTAATSGITDTDGKTAADNSTVDYVYTYQWILVDGGTETDITGATSDTYTPVAGDVGKKVKVKVSFTDDDDNVEEPDANDAYPATGSIVAADARTLSIAPASATEGSSVTFRVTMSQTSTSAVTVNYSPSVESDDTATLPTSAPGGADFTNVSNQSPTIAAGNTTAITTTDDNLDERDETFDIVLSNLSNEVLPASLETTTVTIADNDPSPTVGIAPTSATEGSPVTFAVSLSTVSGRSVTCNYSTSIAADDTATADDFTAVSNQAVTITEGSMSATFSIATTNDTADENNETFTVALSSPSGATISGTGSAKGTINDNDEGTTEPPITEPLTDVPAPDNLTYTSGIYHVKINWARAWPADIGPDDPDINITGHKVERTTYSSGPYTELVNEDYISVVFTEAGLEPGATCYCRIYWKRHSSGHMDRFGLQPKL